MAKRKTLEERIALIEQKYNKRFARLYERYKNKSWSEFVAQWDVMKAQIQKEVEDASRGYNLDGQNGVGDERPVADNISDGGDGLQ